MSGAEFSVVVFEAVVGFLCIDVRAHGDALYWLPYIEHISTLTAFRQTQRIPDSRLVTQVDLTLLRLRLFVSRRELHHTRESARIALSFLRVMTVDPTVTMVVHAPSPVSLLGETDDIVVSGIMAALEEIADAVHRGVTLDIWNPPDFDDFSDEDADEDADAA
jgi:hypothetical protein